MLNLWAGVKFAWKLGRQISGIFGHEKFIVLWMFSKLWECQGTQNLWFFKLHMNLESNFGFDEGSILKGGFSSSFFWAKCEENWFFSMSFFKLSPFAKISSYYMAKMLNHQARVNFGWKLGRQILGIFWYEKIIVLWMFLKQWECQGTQNLYFLSCIWSLSQIFGLMRDWPKKGGVTTIFKAKCK